MKKLSLSHLSKNNLDKLEQSATTGGGYPVCTYICDGCPCSSMYDGAVGMNNWLTNNIADELAVSN